jgi:nitrite reductase (NO-forming)
MMPLHDSRDPDVVSDLLDAHTPTNRRAFLGDVTTLGFMVGGAALVGCRQEPQRAADTTAKTANQSLQNANSKLDTGLTHNAPGSSATGVTQAPNVAFQPYDPALPPLSAQRTLRLHWHAREVPIRVSDDDVVAAWTFEGTMPGPFVHCRVGDTIEFTLTNDVDIPHSMDFHAAQIDPKVAFRSVPKGGSVTFTFKPKYAGAFMYHCGTAPVLMHIGSGMNGAIIVSPAEPLPPAKEFVLVESELYLAPAAAGIRAFDYQKMLTTLPDMVVFNGRPNQYVKNPIHVKVGDRVRFWVVNAGPTHPCNFHVVGEQFDTVYLAAPPGSPLRGVQTWAVAPGGGMCFDLVCDVPGEFPFVNHGFGHGQKGAIGFLVVDA